MKGLGIREHAGAEEGVGGLCVELALTLVDVAGIGLSGRVEA